MSSPAATLEALGDDTPEAVAPSVPVWLWPAVMLACSAIAVAGAFADPGNARLWYLVPYTFLGNSLAPLPYDGAIVYLGERYPLWLVVVVGTAATVVIEFWNMELLARILSREGTRRFRGHRATRWTLEWYQRAPFLALVATGVLPIVPHYPMRILATLARYPMWKYQLSVILGRGARYAWLGAIGALIRVPPLWLALASLVFLLAGIRGARRMSADDEVMA